MTRRDADVHGIVVVDKPAGVSSAQVVAGVRRALRVRRVGHTGTLDPLATGVLPICVGEATKLAGYLLADDKEYEAELVLGVETDTLDAEGAVVSTACEAAAAVTIDDIRGALPRFVGAIEQVPPMYSALKQDGRRLYELARDGVEVERAARSVTVYALELLAFVGGRVRLRIACSKGTYVRSLAADLGRALGCGAHLSALRRTRSGAFTLSQAVPRDALAGSPLIPLPDALDLPRFTVPPALLRAVLDGKALALTDCSPPHGTHPSMTRWGADGALAQLLTPGGALLALVRLAEGCARPVRVFTYGLTAGDSSANLARSHESNA